MQFMEPLGTTDGSVAAGWDYHRHQWRTWDLVEVTQELAPSLMRWGGCFSSYRWKEAVGPRAGGCDAEDVLLGGTEDDRVGTMEFLDFCRQVGAAPLMCVNFECDGRRQWMNDAEGRTRVGARPGGRMGRILQPGRQRPAVIARSQGSRIRFGYGRLAMRLPTTREVLTLKTAAR